MKRYINGQSYEPDFNYEGMIKFASKVKHTDSLDKLEKLAYSFCAVNYHTLGANLHKAVNKLKAGNNDIKEDIKLFVSDIKKEITITELCESFEVVPIDDNDDSFLFFNNEVLCSFNETKKELRLIPFFDEEKEQYHFTLMQFFVEKYLCEEIILAERNEKRIIVKY